MCLKDNNSVTLSKDMSTENDYTSLDHCLEAAAERDLYSLAELIRGHDNQPSKKAKITDVRPLVYIRLKTNRQTKDKQDAFVTLKCLLDTGASGTLISAKHASILKCESQQGPATVWNTPAGPLNTTQVSRCKFIMPEFHRDRVIEWNITVAPMDLGAHDLIIGRDLLGDLGFKFDFTDLTIEWDGVVIPMREAESMTKEAFYVHEPDAVESEADRLRGILDAKYEKANLAEIASQATHLNKTEQNALPRFFPIFFPGRHD